MDEPILWGLPLSVVTALIVELVKRLTADSAGQPTIKDREAVAMSVAVGLFCALLANVGSYAGTTPEQMVDVVGAGILAGLGACGIYSLTKARPKTR